MNISDLTLLRATAVNEIGGEVLELVSSFKPIIDKHSRILILGSMPGVESLRLQQYYGNPRNQFWRMLYEILEAEPSQVYEEKISFIKSKKIALWDVIENCYREGSLDSNIREEKVNNFNNLFKAYCNLKVVLFNGGKAYASYKKWIGFATMPNLTFHKLTSSSPANTKKYDDKLREWSLIRELLKD